MYHSLKKSKLTQICLFIEALTNLVRAVYLFIDPFLSSNVFPFQAHRILVFVTIPWSISTSLLIALFWAEAVTRSTPVKIEFLQRFKVHFIVFLVVFVLLEQFASILHAFRLRFIRVPLVTFVALLGMCAQLFVALVFFVFGSRVLKILQRGISMVANVGEAIKQKSKLRKMTKRIIGSGVGMLIFVFAAAVAGSSIFDAPYGQFFSYAAAYTGLQITSIFQIVVFQTIPSKRSVVPQSSVPVSSHSTTSVAVQALRIHDAKP